MTTIAGKTLPVFLIACVGICFGLSDPCAAEDLDLRILEAREAFKGFILIPDHSIPEDFVSKSNCIMIFPNTVKGGFLFAMRHGQGVILARDEKSGRWSAPAFARISGGSFGLQAGAEWMDLIMIAKSEVAIRALLQNRFTVGGSLSAVAGPWGRHAEFNADWQLKGSMFTYAQSKGLFASVSTEGSVISL